jgi:hypothetical protein
VEQYLKQLKKNNAHKNEIKDIKGQFNIILNLIKGQITKLKMYKDPNDLVLTAFKFMMENDHLVIPALQLGFQCGYVVDYASYQSFYDIRVKDLVAKEEVVVAPKVEVSGRVKVQYMDKCFKDIKISDYGELLCAHTNLTLMKVLTSFRKTNIENITKPSSLVNNFISFSTN